MSSLFQKPPSTAAAERRQKKQLELAKEQRADVRRKEGKERQAEGARQRALLGRTGRGQGQTLTGPQTGVSGLSNRLGGN